jgi:hypothetical protein
VAAEPRPGPAELAAALGRHGFVIAGGIDDDREIHVEAVHG